MHKLGVASAIVVDEQQVPVGTSNLAISIRRLLKVRNVRRTMKQLLIRAGASEAVMALLPP